MIMITVTIMITSATTLITITVTSTMTVVKIISSASTIIDIGLMIRHHSYFLNKTESTIVKTTQAIPRNTAMIGINQK
ncbi:hypothetical protein [Bacillus cereus]|uniref:hypothetical protein n=1 Tax=Bacillus cereus TaxID=1396 RepID=UPI0015D4F9BD|nr:hypothetical protein [Bacillus cereus]